MKKCTKCGIVKGISEYNERKDRPGKIRAECKVCESNRSLLWQKQNPDAYLKREYGITMKEYDDMAMSQGGLCIICHTCNPGGKQARFSVDHDHISGKIRGLLCSHCNSMLGMARDNPRVLRDAANYLEYHSEVSVGD